MNFNMTFGDILNHGFVRKFAELNQHEIPMGIQMTLIIAAVLVTLVASYLLGSLNFAIIISGRQYKQDIRNFGSKNAGMTNMMRTYGKKAAGLTLLGDALKAVAAAIIGYALLGQLGAYIAGVFCILGHMFPAFYKFKGGKGVVTTAVSILMCNPIVFLILITIFVIIVAFTKYISLGSVMCVLLYPLILDRIERLLNPSGGSAFTIFAVLVAVLVVFKHRENIKRLLNHTESKFSFKKSVKTNKEEK